MPVREFTGELDKPKVREFTGQLDHETSDTSPPAQSPSVLTQLGRGLALSGRAAAEAVAGTPMLAMDAGVGARNLAAMLSRGELPTLADFNPFASSGGSRMDYELPSSIMRRSVTGLGVPEPQGFAENALSFATGMLTGGKLPGPQSAQQAPANFRPTSDFEFDQAVNFAREQKAPFPLSSGAPQSVGGRAQLLSRGPLAGELRTQRDATKVTQFLNRQVSEIVDHAKPVDAAALKGQRFLREVFEPGELAYRRIFANFKTVVGEHAAVPLTNTAQVAKREAQALAQRGSTSPAIQQVQKLAKNPSGQMTAQQLDDLHKELSIKLAKNGAGYSEVQRVLGAIIKDMDAVGKTHGLTFADDAAEAFQLRESWRVLRSIPGLERLAKSFNEKGGTLNAKQWMSELFANPDGKALAELRARNPALYHELADSWLASHINRFSKPVKEGLGRALDGSEFRAWFELNHDNLRLILGAERAKALDNFSMYAKHMTGAVQRHVQPGRLADPVALAGRAAGEAKVAAANPYLIIPGEAAAYWVARSLSDPKHWMFNLFSKGMSPATRSFLAKSGALAAQRAETTARDGEDSR